MRITHKLSEASDYRLLAKHCPSTTTTITPQQKYSPITGRSTVHHYKRTT